METCPLHSTQTYVKLTLSVCLSALLCSSSFAQLNNNSYKTRKKPKVYPSSSEYIQYDTFIFGKVYNIQVSSSVGIMKASTYNEWYRYRCKVHENMSYTKKCLQNFTVLWFTEAGKRETDDEVDESLVVDVNS
jgi:hypothetical protein